MTRSTKQKAILSLIEEKIVNAEFSLSAARQMQDFRSSPMFGFKPEDYDYPKITQREADDKVESTKEKLDEWNEIKSYIVDLFNINNV